MHHLTEILSYVGIKKKEKPVFRLKDLLHTHYVFPLYFLHLHTCLIGSHMLL